MTGKVVLVALVDALRHDYVNQEDAPFLYNLGRLGLQGPMRETFAFELRPAFFAGLHPEDSGVANMFYYDPSASPFAAVEREYSSRADIDAAVREEERRRGHTASAQFGFSAEIPVELLPNFCFSETMNTWEPGSLGEHPTVFDYLRREGKEWLWIGYPVGDLRTQGVLADFKRQLRPEHALVYLHFAELDWVGHAHGPDSAERRRTMREVDDGLRQVYSILNQTFSEVRGVVFGDHGMVGVQKTIDLESSLQATGLSLGADYLYFLDSTQARFWFFRDKAREIVLELLSRQEGGRLLTDQDKETLRFRFPDSRFGAEIFVVGDKTAIFPNFFQHENPPSGMHGYLPDVRDNWSACILSGVSGKHLPAEPFSMVRLFPTILTLLDIPVPEQIEPLPLDLDMSPVESLGLSVVIPSYNRREVLEQCLAALRCSEGIPPEDYEIIVVDDGSNDGTEETLALLQQRDSEWPLRYFGQKNRGPAAARNRALREARGRVIVILNDDTIVSPSFLKTHADWHREHPAKADALLGSMAWDADIKTTPFRFWLEKCGPLFALEGLREGQQLDYRYLVTANLSLKRSFLATHGVFDEDFRKAMLEDTELGFRLCAQGLRISFSRGARGVHRHEITLQDFCERQREVGRNLCLLFSKHPQLKLELLPALSNPLFIAGSEAAEDLKKRLASLEQDDELLRSLEQQGEGGPAFSLLGKVYRSLIGYYQIGGLLQELDADAELAASLFGSMLKENWATLGLEGLPMSHRMAIVWFDELSAQMDQLRPGKGGLADEVYRLQERESSLYCQLQEMGRHYQSLEQQHKDLLDQYSERQRAVEELAAQLDQLQEVRRHYQALQHKHHDLVDQHSDRQRALEELAAQLDHLKGNGGNTDGAWWKRSLGGWPWRVVRYLARRR